MSYESAGHLVRGEVAGEELEVDGGLLEAVVQGALHLEAVSSLLSFLWVGRHPQHLDAGAQVLRLLPFGFPFRRPFGLPGVGIGRSAPGERTFLTFLIRSGVCATVKPTLQPSEPGRSRPGGGRQSGKDKQSVLSSLG